MTRLYTCVLFCLLALSTVAWGGIGVTSNGTGGGNWSVGATWNGGIAPVSTDNVIIADGDVVTIDGAVTTANLTIGGGTSGVLQFDATTVGTVTVNGTLTIGPNGTFRTASSGTVTAHVLNVYGDFINNGTLNFSTNGGLANAQVNFGNGTQTGFANFTCGTSSTTNFRGGAISAYGTFATASTTISNIFPNTTGMIVGMFITGTGIPALATVASIVDANTITISASTTAVGAFQYIKTGFNTLAAGFTGATLNRGTDNTSGLNFTPGGTLTAEGFANHGFLTITAGLLEVIGTNSVTSALLFPGSVAIPHAGGLWLNNPNFTVIAQNGSYTVTGILHVSAGTLNVGYSVGNSITLNTGTTLANGSTVTIDGGTVNVAGRLFGAATAFYTFNMSAGTVNVATCGQAGSAQGSFALTNVTATTGSVVNITGGTINIAKQNTNSTVANRRDYNVQANPGLVTVSGGTVNIGTDPVATISGTLNSTTTVSGVSNFNGVAVGLPITGTNIPGGTTISAVNNSGTNGTITLSQAATGNGTVTLSVTSNSFVIAGLAQNVVAQNGTTIHSLATSIKGDLTINSGATLSATNSTTDISVSGNWINNGTFTPNATTGAIVFDGTGAQSITKASGEAFNLLTINKASGALTLNNNVSVANTLTMNAGNVALNSNTLTLGTSLGSPGTLTYTAGYLTGTGTFARWFATVAISGNAGLFPMGVGANNRSLPIGGSPSTGGPIAVSYINATTVSSITFTENLQSFVNRYDANWVVTPSGGYTDGAMTLTIHGDGITGITSVADLNVSAAAVIATGVWAPPSGTTSAPVLTRNGLTQSTIVVNPFYIASVGSSPLPVEMKSFTATATGTSALLRWSTATEVNNMGFDVERKSAKSDWAKIGFVAGNGTSNAPHSYTYADNAAAGTYSYRLKQIDRDGKFEYSSVVEVKIALTAADYTLQQNYPNPFNPATVVRFAVPTAQKATLKIYNSAGQEVATLFNGIADASRMYELSFDGSQLASGVYFSILQSGGKQDVKKMTLLR